MTSPKILIVSVYGTDDIFYNTDNISYNTDDIPQNTDSICLQY